MYADSKGEAVNQGLCISFQEVLGCTEMKNDLFLLVTGSSWAHSGHFVGKAVVSQKWCEHPDSEWCWIHLYKFRLTLLQCCFLESLVKLWFKENVGGCGRNGSRDGSTTHQRCSSSLQLTWHHLEFAIIFPVCWDGVLLQRLLQHFQNHKPGNVWIVLFLAGLLVLNNQFQSFLNQWSF